MNIKSIIPWQTRLIGKIILSRIPVNYNIFKGLNIFIHGKMDKPEYAISVFKYHFDRVKFDNKNKGYTVLELGPGDSLFSGIVSNALGANKSYLVDVGFYAENKIKLYRELCRYLNDKGFHVDKLNDTTTINEMMKKFNINYLTEGLSSLKKIPNNSVDFIWSHAVLEHVKNSDFLEMMIELRRVMKDGGVCSHRIDLKDHLGGKLNNLRFSKKVWESKLMSSSGFYTNRIRFQEMTRLFSKAGFSVELLCVDKWSLLPVARSKLSKEFSEFEEDDLLVSGFDVVLH